MKPNEPLKTEGLASARNQSGCKSGKCRPVSPVRTGPFPGSFRHQRGTLEGSLATSVSVPSMPALLREVQRVHGNGKVDVNPQGYDPRVGRESYLVTHNGSAIGFLTSGVRKETVRIHAAELEQCGGKKVAKVEIPDYEIPEHQAPAKALIDEYFDSKPPYTHEQLMNHKPAAQYHCRRCDKDVIDGRCECLSSPSPWQPKAGPTGYAKVDLRKLPSYRPCEQPRNIWKWIAIILFLLLAFMTVILAYTIEQQGEVIEFQQQLFEELEKSELPQGDGTIQDPGVLPEKPKAPPAKAESPKHPWQRLSSNQITIDQITGAAIAEVEATQTF